MVPTKEYGMTKQSIIMYYDEEKVPATINHDQVLRALLGFRLLTVSDGEHLWINWASCS